MYNDWDVVLHELYGMFATFPFGSCLLLFVCVLKSKQFQIKLLLKIKAKYIWIKVEWKNQTEFCGISDIILVDFQKP